MFKKLIFYFFAILLLNFSLTQTNQTSWAQETLKKLTLEEKIGQLFISAVIIDPDINTPEIKLALDRIDHAPVEKLIKAYHVGGIIFDRKGIDPKRQLDFTKNLQQISKIPLLIAQDLEWGLDMRLKNVIKFPYNITLGALQDNNLIYKLGKEIARECQMIGVNFNLAPVCDVNTNTANPIINHRSFGENRDNVAQKAIAYMLGLQDAGIIASAKHFPGHGDTKLDSHLDLPIIEHNLDRLENIELYPFKKMIDAGVMSVMIGHLQVPALEPAENTPATASYKIITELLKNQLGFDGLVITDALNMEGALKYCKPGEIELKALLAGADILLCPRDTPMAIFAIKEAIKNGIFSQAELDKKVLKILQAKEWVIKNKPANTYNNTGQTENNVTGETENSAEKNTSETKNFMQQLNSQSAYELNQEIYKNAVTLVQNQNNILPLAHTITQENNHEILSANTQENTQNNIACVQISNKKNQLEFFKTINKKINFEQFYLSNNATPEDIQELLLKLKKYNTVIIGLFSMNNYSRENFGVHEQTLEFIKKLGENNFGENSLSDNNFGKNSSSENNLNENIESLKSKNIILAVFGNPYSLKLFNDINLSAIIEAYEHDESQFYAAKIILGETKPVGKLPVSASEKYYASLELSL